MVLSQEEKKLLEVALKYAKSIEDILKPMADKIVEGKWNKTTDLIQLSVISANELVDSLNGLVKLKSIN